MADKKTVDAKKTTGESMLLPTTVLKLELAWSEVEPVFNKVRRRLAKNVKLDGFRKGAVPPHLAEQAVGVEHIVEHTLEEMLPTAYPQLLKKENKEPMGSPEFQPVKLQPGETWLLDVHIAERPEINTQGYEKITRDALKSHEASVKDQKKQAEKDKKTTEKKSASNEKDPAKERNQKLGAVFAALVTTLRPRLPELLVKQEAQAQLRQFGEQLAKFNLTFEEYLKQRGQTEQDLSSQVTGEALGRLQLAFIVDRLIRDLKIEISDKDLEQEVNKLSPEGQEYYRNHPEAKESIVNRLQQLRLEDHLLGL